MVMLASQLVTDGLSGGHIAFGPDGTAVPMAQMAETGASYLSGGAAGAVGILMTNDRPTVEILLGAMVAGVPIVSLPSPSRGADPVAYGRFLEEVCRTQGIDEIVAEDSIAALLDGFGLPVRPHADLAVRPLAEPPGGGFRLVQFSSGSTARPKPVSLDDAALGANLAAVLAAVGPRPGDTPVSWLPLSHDMGLVGMLLVSTAAASPRWAGSGTLVLLDPLAFLRRPALWIETISHWRGTFTAAPDFGYQMAARRPPTAAVDLSSLRCAIVGGEITKADTLAAFTTTYRGRGVDPAALCPAYGMAELGVAAAMTPPPVPWRSVRLSTGALADERVAPAVPALPATTLVACGPPLSGYKVRCRGPSGGTGTISVWGPSVGVDGRTGETFAGPDGWYTTGDTGFVDDDGWLYVAGRQDDYLVTHGRNIYAPAVEAAVAQLDGVRSGRVTAVGLPNGEWAVVAEPAARTPLTTAQLDTLRRDIGRAAVRVTAAQPDHVVVAERGHVPLTASGKLQRNEVRKRLLRDDIATASAAVSMPAGP